MLPQRYSTLIPSSLEIQLGLEALTLCPKKNQTENHCSSCMMTSSVVSSSDSSLVGDYIGMESCFDLEMDCVGSTNTSTSTSSSTAGVCSQSLEKQRCRRRRRRKTMMMKREFPPPIPSLAYTENNLSCHMPWVLKRYYTNDGRLILREEKVRHHEYLHVHRSNGRLTLHLVPLNDDDDYDNNEIDHEVAEEEVDQVNVFDDSNINISNNNNAEDGNGIADHKSNKIVETLLIDNIVPVIEDSVVKCSVAETPPIENGIAANGAKCLSYTSVIASPTCFLGLPVPAIRPVHT
ncbi:hypothetical protein PTKIN_Ptkin01aG0037300 [Pterospermum kingtungense]